MRGGFVIAGLLQSAVSGKWQVAGGRFWVSPGTLETKVGVGPNSPKDAANLTTSPERKPGSMSGMVTVADPRRFARAQSSRGGFQPAVHRFK